MKGTFVKVIFLFEVLFLINCGFIFENGLSELIQAFGKAFLFIYFVVGCGFKDLFMIFFNYLS
jgi:hypothetical protein